MGGSRSHPSASPATRWHGSSVQGLNGAGRGGGQPHLASWKGSGRPGPDFAPGPWLLSP